MSCLFEWFVHEHDRAEQPIKRLFIARNRLVPIMHSTIIVFGVTLSRWLGIARSGGVRRGGFDFRSRIWTSYLEGMSSSLKRVVFLIVLHDIPGLQRR